MEYIEIGYTMKPHGLNGEIKIFVQEQWEDAIDDLDVVFIELKGKKVPYFLEQVRGGLGLIASFEDIDTRDDALTISSKPLWAKADDLPEPSLPEPSEGPYWVGFTMCDATTQAELGHVIGVVEYPHQVLAVLKRGDQELLIPMVEAYVKSTDTTAKLIMVNLPDGLLDL
jgi:16S rRNA processing protein RimM